MTLNTKLRIHRFYIFLREAMPIMIFIMLIFFGAAIIRFQRDNQYIIRDTQATVKNTETIVVKQDETLEAIARLAADNKVSGDQLREILLCMLIVPIEQRTYDVANRCREQGLGSAAQENIDSPPPSPQAQTLPPANTPSPVVEPETPHPTPPQSILPFVDDTLVGCILGICI